MNFGDYFSTSHSRYNTNNWLGNITVFGGTWHSEINDYYTELGALAQERNLENGHVGSQYTIFLKKAQYDGRNSPWHVFGYVYQNQELLKYIYYVAGENDGVPRRKITITNCKILYQ